MKKAIRIGKLTDLFIQALLIVMMIAALVAAVADGSFLLIALIGFAFLGAWQLISALIWTLLDLDHYRAWYLGSASIYCTLIACLFSWQDQTAVFHPAFLYIAVFGIPAVAGVYYFLACMTGWHKMIR